MILAVYNKPATGMLIYTYKRLDLPSSKWSLYCSPPQPQNDIFTLSAFFDNPEMKMNGASFRVNC